MCDSYSKELHGLGRGVGLSLMSKVKSTRRLSQDYLCARPEAASPSSPVPSTAKAGAHEGHTEVMEGLSPHHGNSKNPMSQTPPCCLDGGKPR